MFFEVGLPSPDSYRTWLRQHLGERTDFPLSEHNPERSFPVLVTPEVLRCDTENANGRSRLYGWLVPAYMDRGNSLLSEHLPHRDRQQLAEAVSRIGWVSWEDCKAVEPGACRWLPPLNPSVPRASVGSL